MVIDDIKKYLSPFGGTLSEDKGLYTFSYNVAARNTAVNKTSVSYTAKFRVLDSEKLIKFTEVIKESSSGLGVGGDMTPGIGFEKESYKVTGDGREGAKEEKSVLGGKKLEYTLDYGKIRNDIKDIAKDNSYNFKYKILPWGI